MQQPTSALSAPDLSETHARLTLALGTALGPLVAFLDDPLVVEIMLNADGAIWVERRGTGMQRTEARMEPVAAEAMLRLVAADAGVELTVSKPQLAAKLPPPWGARLQAFLPPVVDAPAFPMRLPPRTVFSFPNYVRAGILTPDQSRALVTAIHAQPGALSWRDAVMAAMRVRPDRIIVGEIRDGSALELLKAWNTGHPGGLATIHANDTRGTLDRFCQLLEEVVYPAPRALVAQTIHLCVHITRDASHPAGRRVSGIDRVVGLDADGSWNLEPAA
jgi:type IV secretion system protein VirB11